MFSHDNFHIILPKYPSYRMNISRVVDIFVQIPASGDISSSSLHLSSLRGWGWWWWWWGVKPTGGSLTVPVRSCQRLENNLRAALTCRSSISPLPPLHPSFFSSSSTPHNCQSRGVTSAQKPALIGFSLAVFALWTQHGDTMEICHDGGCASRAPRVGVSTASNINILSKVRCVLLVSTLFFTLFAVIFNQLGRQWCPPCRLLCSCYESDRFNG